MVVAMAEQLPTQVGLPFKKPALVVLVTTRALPLLPPRTPLQPLLSKLPARAAVYFPQQQQGGALGLFPQDNQY